MLDPVERARQAAAKLLGEKLKEIDTIMRECEQIAKDFKLDFCFETPCGNYESFDGTGEYNDGEPLGWDQSQC